MYQYMLLTDKGWIANKPENWYIKPEVSGTSSFNLFFKIEQNINVLGKVKDHLIWTIFLNKLSMKYIYCIGVKVKETWRRRRTGTVEVFLMTYV